MRRYLIWAAAVVLLATACGRPARQELIVGTPADGFRTDGDRANLGMFPINVLVDQLVHPGADYDRQVEAALGASDRAEATRLSAESMHLAIDMEAVVVPVAAMSWLFAMTDDVQGFVLHGSARHVRWAPVFVAERGS